RAGDWADLGPAGVGHLVGAGGYSPHFNPGAVADLCELSGAAALLHQRPDADAGRSPGGVWSARRAAGVFLHLVLPHPASAAGHWRRRLDESTHVARAADQLAGISLLCLPGVLVALPPGAFASRGRRSPRHEVFAKQSSRQNQPPTQPEPAMNALKFLF